MNEMSLMWMQEVQVHLFFSKFAKLQPKQSVMALVVAGSASTRLVCIFTIHQNVKLMMIAAKLGKLTENDSTPPCSLQPCLAHLQCNPPRCECFLEQCVESGDTSHLSERLQTTFDNQVIKQIALKK